MFPTSTNPRAAEIRRQGRARLDARNASACETCRDGCTCDGENPDRPNGCGHLGCWGPDAPDDYDCPEAVRIDAAFPLPGTVTRA